MIARLARFLPFVNVGAWLVAWLVLTNLALNALNETVALAWLPDRSSGVGFVLESRQRVDAAVAAYRSGAVADDRPLGAVVGISDVREGVQLDTMAHAMQDHWRLVGVAGAGAGISSVEEQAALLLDGKLRPDVVVIGISPLQLVESADFERGARAEDLGTSDVVGKWRTQLRGALWFVQRRSDLNGWLDRTLLDARSFVAEFFGAETSLDTRSPWRPLLRTLGMEHYPPSVLQRSLKVAEASGARKVATFERSMRPFAAAGNMVRRFQAQGALVVLIIMPRHPWFEAILPPSLDSLIVSRLRVASADPDLLVIDYSDVVSAAGFIDLVHLNTSGGEAFSKQLARDLLMLDVKHDPRRLRVQL